MAVEKMKMLTVSGKMTELDAFIDRCCLDGRIQVEQAAAYITDTMGYVPLTEPNVYADRLAAVRELAASFGRELHYREDVRGSQDDAQVDSEQLAAISGQLQELQQQRVELQKQASQARTAADSLSHFIEIDLPMREIFDSRFIRVRFGRMPQASVQKLQRFDKDPFRMFFPCSNEGEDVWGVYFAPVSKVDEIDRVFASLYFQRLILPTTDETPEKAVEGYRKQAEKLEQQVAELDSQMEAIWMAHQETCDYMYSRLLYRNTLHEVRSHVMTRRGYFLFVGWLPAKEEKAVLAALETLDVQPELTDPGKGGSPQEMPPTRLKNNAVIRPYEEFVEMYGLPGYRDIDPTAFLSIIYTVLFGIMFADLGQGLCVAALGLFLWLKSRSRMGGILLRCGLSSAVFGTLFGSVFGNEEALDGFYANVLHMDKPIVIMRDVTFILVAAIGIGVFLLIVAMGLNVWACIRRRHFGEALFSENGITGIAVYASLVLLILKFMGGDSFAALPSKPVVFVLLCGLLLLYFKEILIGLVERKPDWKPESWGDYLLANLFELIEYVLSYFSNTVSFLRVGAFVLVHAGMMLVVYSLAPESGAARVIVLVLGNALIMGIEGVLTYIQVLRLGFYEMFSRFYQGDGKPFHPFRLQPAEQKTAETAE